MENYRMELDALNALVKAQHRTNELLEKLLERGDNREVSHDSTTKTHGKQQGRKPRVPA